MLSVNKGDCPFPQGILLERDGFKRSASQDVKIPISEPLSEEHSVGSDVSCAVLSPHGRGASMLISTHRQARMQASYHPHQNHNRPSKNMLT